MSPFGGRTYDKGKDGKRLSSALERIAQYGDGAWRFLAMWRVIGQCSEAGASARLRDFNKAKFAHFGLKMESRRGKNSGQWLYRLIPSEPSSQPTLFSNDPERYGADA